MQQNQEKSISTKRNLRIATIKDSLKKIPIIRKNTTKVEQKIKHFYESESTSPEMRLSQQGDDMRFGSLHSIDDSTMFEEKYQIQESIGQGANGFVNKCKKIKTGKMYAVKSSMMDEQHIMQLKENFLAIHSLKHPNIIEYHALYIDMRKKLCSIVMQYVHNPSLQKLHIQNQEQLKEIIYQLLGSLKYLHERNISHRDIKPQNILYDSLNRTIKIIDFGTSKRYYRRSKKFQMLTITGTLYYRAPEMFTGGGYNEKVDIWAVGCMIYKMITGKTPFESIYLSETINRIKDEEASFEGDVWQRVDLNLKNLIKRMLKKDKSVRLSAAQCLRDMWFYSLTLNKLSQSTKDYKTYMFNLENAEYNKKILKKFQQTPKKFESLTCIIQKVDGEDYHLIDSEEEEEDTAWSSKSLRSINKQKRSKKNLTGSVVF